MTMTYPDPAVLPALIKPGHTLPITDHDCEVAYRIWRVDFRPLIEADVDVRNWLAADKPAHGSSLLKLAREELGLTQREASARLGMTPAAYRNLEEREAEGTITLKRMRWAAEGLGLELAYAIRPRQREIFSKLVWSTLRADAVRITQSRRITKDAVARTIAANARELFFNGKYRRSKDWSERHYLKRKLTW